MPGTGQSQTFLAYDCSNALVATLSIIHSPPPPPRPRARHINAVQFLRLGGCVVNRFLIQYGIHQARADPLEYPHIRPPSNTSHLDPREYCLDSVQDTPAIHLAESSPLTCVCWMCSAKSKAKSKKKKKNKRKGSDGADGINLMAGGPSLLSLLQGACSRVWCGVRLQLHPCTALAQGKKI